ncbi:hypothetical protein KKC91_03900 [bacterium]|nr:hypothetical protein [bacterium]
MTSKEIVIRAVKFQGPERIAHDLPEPWGTDFFTFHSADIIDPGWKPKIEGEDEWGCVWEKLPSDKTMGQVKIHPLNSYEKLDSYPFPDYNNPERYKRVKQRIKENTDNKFVLASIPLSFIHRLEYLRGHIEAWTDPYEHPDELSRLLDILADIAITAIRNLAKFGVNGIISADDWGLQDRPMVSPEIFRKFFKPHYKRVYRIAHELGMLTFLHSCGHIMELLDGLIEAELDVIQMDQQENMGVKNLADRFGGRICFWCPVDIQHTMVNGTLEDIRTYAKNLIDSFGKFNGGFISKWYPSPEAVGHSKERIDAMAKAFISFQTCLS